jgi:hypothetical protein
MVPAHRVEVVHERRQTGRSLLFAGSWFGGALVGLVMPHRLSPGR